jgi:hypothetical protein
MDGFSSRPERRLVELSGYAVLADGATIAIALVDLSYEGCKVRTDAELKPGDRMKLSVFHRGLIEAEVRWFADGIAGLTFSTYEVPGPQHWPRRSQRVPTTAEVTVRKPGHANFRVRVLDASPEGCRLEFVERPAEGERMFVKFEGLETLEAEVCWVRDFIMGVNFAKPMHPAVFDLVVERLERPFAEGA